MGSVIGYCKDCKFWDEHKPDEDEEEFFEERRRNWGFCRLGESRGGEPITEGTLVYASDSEMYIAHLETRPEFGCIQFQAKE
jgi:hypothetical protein